MANNAPSPAGNPPLPEQNFDPLTAEADTLEYFKLPARPNEATEPVLFRLWTEMFQPTVEFVQISVLPKSVSPSLPHAGRGIAFMSLRPSFAARVRRGWRRPSSLNWSGGYVHPRGGARFEQVCGTWVVPSTKEGSEADQHGPYRPPAGSARPRPLDYQCSIWIGLDGRHKWANAMPQLGTEHRPDGRTQFWWQWWTQDSHIHQFYVDGLDVQAGDPVYCNLSIVGGTEARFHFLNRSSNKFGTAVALLPRPVLGTSAQWILERPGAADIGNRRPVEGDLHPMLDFGSVTLDGFAAKAASAGPGLRSLEVDDFDLRPTSMRVTRSNPRRTAIVSRPKRNKTSRKLVLDYKR